MRSIFTFHVILENVILLCPISNHSEHQYTLRKRLTFITSYRAIQRCHSSMRKRDTYTQIQSIFVWLVRSIESDVARSKTQPLLYDMIFTWHCYIPFLWTLSFGLYLIGLCPNNCCKNRKVFWVVIRHFDWNYPINVLKVNNSLTAHNTDNHKYL